MLERLKYLFIFLYTMICEMCGKEGELREVIVEGVLLEVCGNCASYGEVINIKPKFILQEKKRTSKNEEIEVIVSDYNEKVKKAREKFGLTQEEVGFKIAEKESTIHSIEAGKLEPNIALARKLEQFFRINLIEKYKEEKKSKKIDFRDGNLTIGDLLKSKK